MNTTPATTTETSNRYALPNGAIVTLHDACKAPVERYQMEDRTFVMAVRVRTDEHFAIAEAKDLEARRVRLGIQGR